MPIHDYVIDNQSAPSLRADLNSALSAIVSQNSNATAPTTTYANMLWYDTANNQLKKRNEANSAWITLGTIDETNGTFTPSGSVITATGSAPLYACRAWVNFNGTGTVAIRASGNVTSITDLGTGSYRVNFTTAMQDANFAVSGIAQQPYSVGVSNAATTSVSVLVTQNGTAVDALDVSIAVFR